MITHVLRDGPAVDGVAAELGDGATDVGVATGVGNICRSALLGARLLCGTIGGSDAAGSVGASVLA